MTLLFYIDGACRGNPGPSSVGVVVQDADGKVIKEHGRAIGVGTNNVAEYTALSDALGLAKELGGRRLKIHSDSQLLVRQFNGQYRVKNPALFDKLTRIQQMRRDFESVELVHVPREQNRLADKLANQALDAVGA
ncbi:MAG TPA: ribonuclease HI family protein [Elusimicrobiota bacterium]|nr:ribonuclease HI family protein [Elusimicrobiota bacterium]